MRGFPLLKTLIVLLWLTVSAVALVKLTRPPTNSTSQRRVEASVIETSGEKTSVTVFDLNVSAEMSELIINDAPHPSHISSMAVALPKDATYISVVIRWKSQPTAGERRFAKLTIYPPGKPTITHVFDSAGDIDDIFELP